MQIKQTARRVVSLEFVRHAATLVSGNVIGQAVAFAAYLLLCRAYAPADFGLFHLFLSVGGFLSFFTTCSFHYAIVLPHDDRAGASCAQICLAINAAASLLCLLAASTVGPWLTELTRTRSLNRLLPLLAPYICASGLWATLNYWFIRRRDFRGIARYQVSLSAFSAGSKLGWAASANAGGLVYGTLAGQYLSLAFIALRSRETLGGLLAYNAARVRVCLRKYSNFLRFTFPKDLVNYLGGNLPYLLLAPWFPLSELGFFGMATTLAMRPVNLLVNAVYQSLYQQCIELYHRRASMRFLGKLLLRGLAVTAPAFTLLYFLLPPLTRWLLGDGWEPTGRYLQLILPWIALTLTLNPFDYLPDIFGRQRALLGFEITLTLLRAAAMLAGVSQGSFALAIGLYTAASCAVMTARALWYASLVYAYEKEIAHATRRAD